MKSLAVALLALVPLAAGAQDTQKGTKPENDRFQGTWKLDVAKSKFSPGPAPQSVTVTIGSDKVTVDEVHADGKTENWSYTPSPGTEATITGMDNASVLEKRVNDRTIEHNWKFGNSTMQGRGVLSRDGKRMTYTLTGTTPDGKPVHNVEIYEKQ
ncbi:MAG: hypothetical protein JOY62_00240 [Acidobacteriaceae bacterium]|nr:hypothetical protein [Acidobacteriaceae bacterium]MBV9778372.1 hypothetical protein [Acidobacteriaceae bacterium]